MDVSTIATVLGHEGWTRLRRLFRQAEVRRPDRRPGLGPGVFCSCARARARALARHHAIARFARRSDRKLADLGSCSASVARLWASDDAGDAAAAACSYALGPTAGEHGHWHMAKETGMGSASRNQVFKKAAKEPRRLANSGSGLMFTARWATASGRTETGGPPKGTETSILKVPHNDLRYFDPLFAQLRPKSGVFEVRMLFIGRVWPNICQHRTPWCGEPEAQGP